MQVRNGKIKVSISEINSFVTCRKLHYKTYILKEESKSIEFSFGSAIHKVCEDLLRAKMGNPAQSPADAPEMFEVFYRDDIKRTGQLDVENWQEPIETGKTLAKLWGEKIYPRMRPKQIEFWVERELYSGPYSFYGKVDYEDERGFIIDWKTAKSAPTKNHKNPDWPVVLDQHYIMQGLNYLYSTGLDKFYSIFLVKEKQEIQEIKFPYSPSGLQQIKPWVDEATEAIIHEIWNTYQEPAIKQQVEEMANITADLEPEKANEIMDRYKTAAYSSYPIRVADGAFKMSPYHYSQCQMCFNKKGCVVL